MPRPRPRIQIPELVSEFRAREKRSLAMPYFPRSTTFDSTKAFKDGRVIYLSDFKISKPCVKNYPIYFGKYIIISGENILNNLAVRRSIDI